MEGRRSEKKHKALGFRWKKAAETGAPKLVDMTCSHCGGTLRMEDETHAKCPFCGALFLIDEPEDVHVNIYLPDHSERMKKIRKWILITALIVGVVILCAVLDNLLVALPSWLRIQQIDPVVQTFYEDVLGDQYRNLSQKDFDRIKYIDVVDVQRDMGDGTATYYLCYSFNDYAEYESASDFSSTVRYWVKKVDGYNPNLNFTRLHGLTYVNLSGFSYYYPKDAPISCVKARDLNQVDQQVCNNSDAKKSRIEKMVIVQELSENLRGFQEYPNLRELNLSLTIIGKDNVVVDVGPLAKCEKLESLVFTSYCSCVGLADLSRLENLKVLKLPDVTVEQATFLAQMPQLETISLGAGKKYDMSNLSRLTHLKHLSLSGGGVKLSELPEFGELESLSCEVVSQEEFDQVVRFPMLKECSISFDMGAGDIWDVTALGRLQNLEYIELYSVDNTPITHLENALNLGNLKGLLIASMSPSCRKVSIDPEALSEESALAYLVLKRCYLYDANTEEKSFEVISRFRNLENLTLYDCGLEDIGMLSGMPKLRQLNVEDNKISDFSPLENCPKLQKLYLGGNPILEPDLPKQIEINHTRTLYRS